MPDDKPIDEPVPPISTPASDPADDIPLEKPQIEPIGLPDLNDVGPGSTPTTDRPKL